MSEKVKQTRVFVVDDHPIVREGIAQLVGRETDLEVCGEAGDAATALRAIAELKPDVAIVDLSMEGISGLQLVKEITAKHKKVAVLVLSMHDERVYAARALRAGARGYVMKHQATKRVVGAIRQVASGELAVSEEIALRLESAGGCPSSNGPPSVVETLTDRELEVFQFIGQGLKTHEIGERLHLSVKTIETHREHIKEKLGIANASELAQQAIAWVHGERTQALANPN